LEYIGTSFVIYASFDILIVIISEAFVGDGDPEVVVHSFCTTNMNSNKPDFLGSEPIYASY
jgi:hypothetical protein